MKNNRYLTILLTLCWSFLAYAQPSSLTIHHIGVGHGDCTLINAYDAPNDKRVIVLIDAGDKGKGAKIVWPYLKNTIAGYVGKANVKFVIICSHLHSDHMGGMVEVLDSIRDTPTPGWGKNVVSFVIDRTIAPDPVYSALAIQSCYDAGVDDPASKVFAKYNTAAADFIRSNITVKTDIFSHYKLSDSFSMACVAANGWVPDNNVVNGKLKNENDLSFGFIVRFGAFKYFTGGDLGGGGASYTDMETPLSSSKFVGSILGLTATPHVCAFKVTHHGSSHSTNPDFLATFNPSLAIFEAGLRSFGGKVLPTKACYDVLLKGCQKLDYTYVLAPFKYYPGSNKNDVFYFSDVIITVLNPVASADGTLTVQYQKNNKAPTSPFEPNDPGPVDTFTCKKQH